MMRRLLSTRQFTQFTQFKQFKPFVLRVPSSVKIVEVGPRDGLQNEKKALSVDKRVNFINQLSNTGLKHIEMGSFVSKRVKINA